eukprot:CAMPEP_0195528756 /NCGR_PEP_ID=MMETSP0794_2-20130614/31045_1 /TAXON_ID=515487 /ORGANISM="Stephanopyxis turris, Strain CCMP 815" /LENGTH=564 /DNA_ID=CAMNT_0040659943 /DNA_START=402 /DNA_END=2096 /DNA_ORIENTATION=-
MDVDVDDSGNINEEPTIVHMRTSVKKSDWHRTTLSQVGVERGVSALLTLNLPSSYSSDGTRMQSSQANCLDASASAPVVAPSPMQRDSCDTSSRKQAPNEADTTTSSTTGKVVQSAAPLTCEQSLDRIMLSHFDAVSKDCIMTLLKIVNNLLQKPLDSRVRSINLSNRAFHKKVGDVAGGVDFLLACGFSFAQPPPGVGGGNQKEMVELLPRNESQVKLKGARDMLHVRAKELGVHQSDLPTIHIPSSSCPSSRGRGDANIRTEFDPFKGHKFNTQAAALGANPNTVAPDGTSYVSNVEKQLNNLTKKAEQMEKSLQSVQVDRMLYAMRPGESQASLSGDGDTVSGAGGKSDGFLLAERMKRMEEERKKRENGGFTTKAMRDLEKMKKAKVYSHTQLRICFPDGCALSARFYPSEKVKHVKEVIRSALCTNDTDDSGVDFDIYVTPPRRALIDSKTLVDEQLVPAAKVHVSWKTRKQPGVQGCNQPKIKPELFTSENKVAGASKLFPDVKSVSKEANKRSIDGPSTITDEDDMVRRMMGKSAKGSLTRKKKSATGGGKPKWFKG